MYATSLCKFISSLRIHLKCLLVEPKSFHPLFPWKQFVKNLTFSIQKEKKAKQASNELRCNTIPTKGWLTIFFSPKTHSSHVDIESVSRRKNESFPLFFTKYWVTYESCVHATSAASKLAVISQFIRYFPWLTSRYKSILRKLVQP